MDEKQVIAAFSGETDRYVLDAAMAQMGGSIGRNGSEKEALAATDLMVRAVKWELSDVAQDNMHRFIVKALGRDYGEVTQEKVVEFASDAKDGKHGPHAACNMKSLLSEVMRSEHTSKIAKWNAQRALNSVSIADRDDPTAKLNKQIKAMKRVIKEHDLNWKVEAYAKRMRG